MTQKRSSIMLRRFADSIIDMKVDEGFDDYDAGQFEDGIDFVTSMIREYAALLDKVHGKEKNGIQRY